ncbi:MAG TPA: hypothetical protein PK926_17180 [Spirochaetota bacterium]|mgnify:CR=1 FL=1|nr:hypothetical protein [Spirochaetota bacterium]HPI90852.1 hypothetical protein [Spirochaetota bacterium]HPR49950.1 hypothetical protein [Spirochaetota bacterium]
MKRMFLLLLCCIVPLVYGFGQEKKAQENKLQSENIDNEGKNLDSLINDLNVKIAGLVKKYDLFNNDGIKILPYRFSYSKGDGYIELERYVFLKDDIYNRDIVGIETKQLRVYGAGQGISKIQYTIYENNHLNGMVSQVIIEDPSPEAMGTDDMLFTHQNNGRKLLENRKLGEVKNSTAFPVRNDIKRDFIVPTLSFFYDSLLFICQSYEKSSKDTEHMMNEFLKKSTKY